MIGDFNRSDSGKEQRQAVSGSVVQKTHSPTGTGVRYAFRQEATKNGETGAVHRLSWFEAAINETPSDQECLATEDNIRKSRQKRRVQSIEVTSCPHLAEI